MTTRYDQLIDLYTRADAESTKRRDAATQVAVALYKATVSYLGVPSALQGGFSLPRRPAVELCAVPADDQAPVTATPPAPHSAAVTTDDGEVYRFGLILRFTPSGLPPHVVLFRVHMKHKLNDTFDVQPWTGGPSGSYSAAGAHADAPEQFAEQVHQAVSEYFTAAVKGDLGAKPIGFQRL